MQSFLEETLNTIQKNDSNFSNAILILPSKRAGSFIKKILQKNTTKTQWLPQIVSIEDFIQDLADLSIIPTIDLIFKSYSIYLKHPEIKEKDSFDEFCNWVPSVLNDFNEIDRHLINTDSFFSFQKDEQSLNRWGDDLNTPSSLISNYLKFWDSLPLFYNALKTELEKEHQGFQGMVYRKAVDELEHYLKSKKGNQNHYFIGFNALNTAEQYLIQGLLTQGNTKVFWDIDTYFINLKNHSASYFINNYLKNWSYYKTHPSPSFSSKYKEPHNITIVDAQKNISQVKYVYQILEQSTTEFNNKTAIVLADESLLVPLLYSIPKSVISYNVTMGVSLRYFPITSLLNSILHFQSQYDSNLYYKNVLDLLNHALVAKNLSSKNNIESWITKKNETHFSLQQLIENTSETDVSLIDLIFSKWNNAENTVNNCIALLLIFLKSKDLPVFEKAVLLQTKSLFDTIKTQTVRLSFIDSVSHINALFQEAQNTEKIDFEGDPHQGLQIMGILETRVLDFENIIMLSVNEGILPTGKSNSSLITNTQKKVFNLPMYFEKDAVYTYHFYRLLQRANNITLLYNSFSDGLNPGEKSRFIHQLEIEGHPNHNIQSKTISPELQPKALELQEVEKSPEILKDLEALARRGFSPTSLTNYLRNPIEFYQRYLLKIKDEQNVEETIAANTLGTIAHDALEALYKPFVGVKLTKENLEFILKKVPLEIENQLQKTYEGGNFNSGKNLLIYEVLIKYTSNVILLDLKTIATKSITIISLEEELSINLSLPEIDYPITLKGTVDRIDICDDEYRIIDYKSGSVDSGNLEIFDWDLLLEEEKYSKAFQVLFYSYLFSQTKKIDTLSAGVISFKKMKKGFMPFAMKNSLYARTKDPIITEEVLKSFYAKLTTVLLEICSPSIPFIEKETKSYD